MRSRIILFALLILLAVAAVVIFLLLRPNPTLTFIAETIANTNRSMSTSMGR